jgi:hypothetical protein
MRQMATTPKKEPTGDPSPPISTRAPTTTGLSIPSLFGTNASTNANTYANESEAATGEKDVGEPEDFNTVAHTLLDTLATSRSPDAAHDATVMEKMRADNDSGHRRENLHTLYSYDTPTKGAAPNGELNEFDSEAANILKSIVPTPVSYDKSVPHTHDSPGQSDDKHWKTIPTSTSQEEEEDVASQNNVSHVSIAASVVTPVSALSAVTKHVTVVSPSESESGPSTSLAERLEPLSPTSPDSSIVHIETSMATNDGENETATMTATGATATATTDATKKNKKKKKGASNSTGMNAPSPAVDGDDYLPEI